MEAACLGFLMMTICFFSALLEYPLSPVHRAIHDSTVRRACIGVAVGLTITSLVYSPWGKRSGAHFNPAITLTFLRLGKVAPWDAVFYVAAHFLGAVGAMFLTSYAFSEIVSSPSVHYAVTVPGSAGISAAVVAETVMAFLLMTLILQMSNTPRLARYTGLAIGLLVATCILLGAPFSGASINPARTVASAIVAHTWSAWWLYFAAPIFGMLAAGQVYQSRYGSKAVRCATLHPHHSVRCIFCAFHSRQHVEDSTTGSEGTFVTQDG